MIKYFSKAFKITNDNIILTTPLVLFLFLLSIYLGIAQKAPENAFSSILLLITILFMLAAFFAGWLYMVKRTIDLDKQGFLTEEDKARASFGLFKEIPTGIGDFFLPFNGALVLYTLLFAGLLFATYHFGIHAIGKVNLTLAQIKAVLDSPMAMKSLISSLSAAELIKINYWNFLFLFTISAISFITMFWAPEIILNTKNPIVAFFKSLIFIFKNFLSSVILFIYLSFVNFAVSLINAFSIANPIVYFISMLIYFYFVVYIVVLVFLYYVSENQPKYSINIAEEHTEANCDCGSDSDGQEQSGDSTGEGN